MGQVADGGWLVSAGLCWVRLSAVVSLRRRDGSIRCLLLSSVRPNGQSARSSGASSQVTVDRTLRAGGRTMTEVRGFSVRTQLRTTVGGSGASLMSGQCGRRGITVLTKAIYSNLEITGEIYVPCDVIRMSRCSQSRDMWSVGVRGRGGERWGSERFIT